MAASFVCYYISTHSIFSISFSYHRAMQVDLIDGVDFSGSQVLGSSHHLSNIIKKQDNELFVESDCDEQLIVTIKFQSPVKLHSFRIIAPENGMRQ